MIQETQKPQLNIPVVSNSISLDLIIRRIISSILFVIILFSPLCLIEVVIYSIRYLINRTSFPNDPYSFQFIKRMWF